MMPLDHLDKGFTTHLAINRDISSVNKIHGFTRLDGLLPSRLLRLLRALEDVLAFLVDDHIINRLTANFHVDLAVILGD